ncbi:beta-crystallin A3-like [Mytilus trossulus]|uniref:beta-crystallin A3-like n=1 Tax=Mytilus trossulus TaxID=6551 RepID=UPI003004E225
MEPKITLFEHDFTGRSKVFTKSCPDLTMGGFNNITSSVKCERGVWILYQEKNYKGQIFVIEDGENYAYAKFKGYFNDKALSLKLLDEIDFTEESECTLYKHVNYTAPTLTFADDVQDLKCYNFDEMTSSVVVTSGAWVGFTQPNYDGYQSLFLKGRYNFSDAPNDKGGFKNDVLSSFSKITLVNILYIVMFYYKG